MSNGFEDLIITGNKGIQMSKIFECNQFLNKYGLQLSEKDVERIAEKRLDALKQTGRIELGEWIIEKIIKEFCDSPYIMQENFSKTIYELIDIFYYYKNETKDLVSDDDLIKFMRKYYDNLAHGDLEYLAGSILEKMKNNVLNSKPIDYEIDIKERGVNNGF